MSEAATAAAVSTPKRLVARSSVATRLTAVLAGLWAGMLLTISAVSTPVPFAVLPQSDAGRVVSVIFLIEAYASVAFAVLLFGFERGRARHSADEGVGSALSANMLLVLGALFCTVLGYFAVQPMMAQARLGQGAWSFGALHAASTVMFVLKTLLVLALAYRTAGR
jgi:hypothetical protein